MKKKITIAIDAMGGDNSPDKTIEGVKIFLNKPSKYTFIKIMISKTTPLKTWKPWKPVIK